MREKRKRWRNYVDAILVAVTLPLWLPLIVLVVFLRTLYGLTLYLAVWFTWLPRGKDVLFVYSDSPIWHGYMMNEVLPVVRERAVVLNWSERKQWRHTLAVLMFRFLAGDHAFNPMVVLFRPLRFAQQFRFWQPFKLYKRGMPEAVEQMRQDLLMRL